MRIILSILLSISLCAIAQTASEDKQAAPLVQGPLDYVCPMDKDVRADKPGFCPRCHMKLVLGIPDDSEFPLDIKFSPRVFRAGEKVQLTFRIADPKTGKTVDHFEIVHDKFFHMFLVSQDLQYFLHDHPVPQPDGKF
ncbi:MAG TPA: heavy metal-binding domain-containing protein, partial [Bryobacteraceae bacterium]